MSIWLNSIMAACVVAAVSWIGSFTFLFKQQTLEKYLHFFVSLSVGVLLGDSFIHLIPEAIDRTGDVSSVMIFTLLGIVGFFILEKIVRWHHHSHGSHLHSHTQIKPFTKLNLIGDGIHNFIDGILIAGSFMVDVKAGWLTALAIVIHEIPQEIGDVGALIYGGYAPKKAVLYNFICSLTAVLGVVFLLAIGYLFEENMVYFLPVCAGAFIYISASDLIPELHNATGNVGKQLFQGIFMIMGIFIILALKIVENFIW